VPPRIRGVSGLVTFKYFHHLDAFQGVRVVEDVLHKDIKVPVSDETHSSLKMRAIMEKKTLYQLCSDILTDYVVSKKGVKK
jgi:hypothetical protein